MNIAEHVKAENNLKALKMTGGDIDLYITTFTKLMKMAGYKENEHGACPYSKRDYPIASTSGSLITTTLSLIP
jgi:hypothetical protein